MKIPKSLQKFADDNNLNISTVGYRAYGITLKRRGFDLLKKDELSTIVVSIEPIEMGKYRWYFRNTHKNYTGEKYFKSFSPSMFRDINPNEKSYYARLNNTIQ